MRPMPLLSSCFLAVAILVFSATAYGSHAKENSAKDKMEQVDAAKTHVPITHHDVSRPASKAVELLNPNEVHTQPNDGSISVQRATNGTSTARPLYNGGDWVTHPDTTGSGSDLSVLQDTSLSMTVLGFGNSVAQGTRVADDFMVTNPGGFRIDEVIFYAYQTGSTTTSTITSLNYQIWDGPPDDPSSNVVFGDTTTDRLVNTGWSNAYRVTEQSLTATNRPVMENTASAGVTLAPGQYWLDWQTGGSASFSGPWAQPITITGTDTTGNGMGYGSGLWGDALDGTLPQGFPFLLRGKFFADPADTAGLIYYNGPIVNSIGLGVGGANESIVQNTTLGLTLYGFGHQVLNANRVADDFTVPPGEQWNVDFFYFYAYQTNSPTTSTITSVNYRIWDGPPIDSTSTIIFGDTTTNQLISSDWSGTYRVLQTTSGTASNRPLMKNLVIAGTTLMPGTYWVDWQSDGSLASGPWIPPMPIWGERITGNGLQQTGTGGWGIADDGIYPQDFSFIILGSTVTGVDDKASTLPNAFALDQNYPNPFNPSTRITYTLPAAVDVSLRVYNALGQEVATLIDGRQDAGAHTANFAPTHLASGIYYYTLRAGENVATRKMLLLK